MDPHATYLVRQGEERLRRKLRLTPSAPEAGTEIVGVGGWDGDLPGRVTSDRFMVLILRMISFVM